MAFKDEQEVFAFIKKNSTTPKWIIDYRRNYSKNIIDLFERIMNPRSSVFNAFGGSVRNDMSPELLDKFITVLAHFKGQKSIKKYLSENFFKLLDTDPNGLLFMEYKEDEKIWPTYKSINDIRIYLSDGQLLKVVLFEPVTITSTDTGSYQEWRVVDDNKDWRIKQQGEMYTVIEDLTFEHPFGVVPACILSDMNVTGSELRVSPIAPIVPSAEDYARDKSIRTIYKFQHGFPRHWRYEQECRSCKGVGKTGDNKSCIPCDGKGHLRRNDVTDVSIIDLPRDSDSPIITPNVEGFVSPDLDTWVRMNEDLKESEDLIEATMWGVTKVKEGANETATGRYIDVQPIMIKLDSFADNVEWVHNKLAHFVESWLNGSPKNTFEFHITYGRRFIIESPDAILDKYTKSRDAGDNTTILDKLLSEYILSKYQSNPLMLDEMQKKRQVEPYIHQSIDQASIIFGASEAYKKVTFVDFWEEADKKKDVSTLKAEFKTFNISNQLVIVNTDKDE